MSSEIVPVGFEFEGIQISAFVDEVGRDWFRGSEVCQVLKIANPATVIKREASKYWKEIQVGVGRPALYVSEPGLYSLIFASKQPIAEKFKEWVFEEVLPKLRADGGYIMPNATSEQIRALTEKVDRTQAKS
jgi:anti-repressor protein